jgi:hypothetical protein
MPQIVGSRYVLAVRNLAISSRYSIDVLGFAQDPIDAEGWSFLSRDCIHPMIGECPDDRAASELANHSYFAYWNVEDVGGLYREFVSHGALLLSPPMAIASPAAK